MTYIYPLICASDVHEEPVPAIVLGTFRGWWDPGNPERAAYCIRCADALEWLGCFEPDTDPL